MKDEDLLAHTEPTESSDEVPPVLADPDFRPADPLAMPVWEVDGPEHLEATPSDAPPSAEEVPVPAPAVAPSSKPKETTPEQPPPLVRLVEAMLFVGGGPLTAVRACEVVRGLTPEDFQQTIDGLNRTYRTEGRPYTTQSQGEGYVLTLRPRFAGVREKLFGGVREARLSQAAVDVLSLVAYRQPATRQEIDSLRGADSGAVLRQLVRHGLVAVQRGEGEDREVRYVTTSRFLELFRLRGLEDLPQTQDLQRL
jgi:segregation and condensation protein B